MPGLIRISLIGFLFFSIVSSCNENKAGSRLSGLDFSLVKGFVSDTNLYEYAFFKMRIFNNHSQPVHLYIEKWKMPVTQDLPGQKKSGSIFMLDSNRHKLNELLLWPIYPNEIIIKANKSIEFFLRASTTGLVNQGGETRIAGFQKILNDRIKSRLYFYYSLNNDGAVDDSAAIRVDSNFLIEYREPLVTD